VRLRRGRFLAQCRPPSSLGRLSSARQARCGRRPAGFAPLAKVVVLNFWGIWCKSCRQEIPHLSALDREWREKGLVVLGADYGDVPEDLAPFVQELEMSYPVLVDDGLADEYEVLVYPTSVVIDRRGRVRARVEGYREESFEDMKSLVERLLEEK
jgi:thiol-disulfide isomerase/thioredoxin